jgi:tetratricopeptide (TPR) repeat protein
MGVDATEICGLSLPFWCSPQRVHGLGRLLPLQRFPQHPPHCVAMRLSDKAEARQALEAAIELEPQKSFALRSLGSLLVITGAFAAGVARFRQALAVAPDDLISTFNLAQALLELDPEEHRNEADRLLLQVIEAQPYGKLANKAKDLRGSIAARDLRADQQEGGSGRTP